MAGKNEKCPYCFGLKHFGPCRIPKPKPKKK